MKQVKRAHFLAWCLYARRGKFRSTYTWGNMRPDKERSAAIVSDFMQIHVYIIQWRKKIKSPTNSERIIHWQCRKWMQRQTTMLLAVNFTCMVNKMVSEWIDNCSSDVYMYVYPTPATQLQHLVGLHILLLPFIVLFCRCLSRMSLHCSTVCLQNLMYKFGCIVFDVRSFLLRLVTPANTVRCKLHFLAHI